MSNREHAINNSRMHEQLKPLNREELFKVASELLGEAQRTVRALLATESRIVELKKLGVEAQAELLLAVQEGLNLRNKALELANQVSDYFNTNIAQLRQSKSLQPLIVAMRFLRTNLPDLNEQQQTLDESLGLALEHYSKDNPNEAWRVGVENFDEATTPLEINPTELPLYASIVIALLMLLNGNQLNNTAREALEQASFLLDEEGEVDQNIVKEMLDLFGKTIENTEKLGSNASIIQMLDKYNAAPKQIEFQYEEGSQDEDEGAPITGLIELNNNNGLYSIILTQNGTEQRLRLSNRIVSDVLGEGIELSYDTENQAVVFTNDQDEVVGIINQEALQSLIDENSDSTRAVTLSSEILESLLSDPESGVEQVPQIAIIGTATVNNDRTANIRTRTGGLILQIPSETQLEVVSIQNDLEIVVNGVIRRGWAEVLLEAQEDGEERPTGFIWTDGDIDGDIISIDLFDEPQLVPVAAPTPSNNDEQITGTGVTPEPSGTETPGMVELDGETFPITPEPATLTGVAVATPDNVPDGLSDFLEDEDVSLAIQTNGMFILIDGMAFKLFLKSDGMVVTYDEQGEEIIVWGEEDDEEEASNEQIGYDYEGLFELATTRSGVNLDLALLQGLIPQELYDDFEDRIIDGGGLGVTIFDSEFTSAGNIVFRSTVNGEEIFLTPALGQEISVYYANDESFSSEPEVFHAQRNHRDLINALGEGQILIGLTAESEYVSEYLSAVIAIENPNNSN